MEYLMLDTTVDGRLKLVGSLFANTLRLRTEMKVSLKGETGTGRKKAGSTKKKQKSTANSGDEGSDLESADAAAAAADAPATKSAPKGKGKTTAYNDPTNQAHHHRPHSEFFQSSRKYFDHE